MQTVSTLICVDQKVEFTKTADNIKKEGVPFKILEVRTRVGGRINTVYASDDTPFEMGATWF